MTDKKYCVVRDKTILEISAREILRTGLTLDHDVYVYGTTDDDDDKQPQPIPSLQNRHRFIVNDNFRSVDDINAYLRYWGKIPSFLELRKTEKKGFGVFTLIDLPKQTFLGYYEGIYRPVDQKYIENRYGFVVNGFDSQPVACIDAENLTFSNWARYINDGVPPNIEYAVYNMLNYIFTLTDIKAGQELLGTYGEGYWKVMESRGTPRVD
jgi:hypothetical protein